MKSALLLIDLQQDFLGTADLQPSAPVLVARAAQLLRACRERKLPIIHIWTTVDREKDIRLPHWRAQKRWMCVAGTPGHKTPEPLRPLAGESIVHKTGFNAFASGELDQILRSAGCDSVIVCGLHLHACVRTAAVESLERNLKVFIAEDAIASNDPIHAAATRRWLAERCVTFQSAGTLFHDASGHSSKKWPHRSPRNTDEILFEVPNAAPNEISDATSAALAFRHEWRRTSLAQRQQTLNTISQKLTGMADELARQMAIDLGKPIRHAREEIHRAAANIQDVIQRAPAALVPKRESAGWVRREPVGVVALISAWNNPVAIPLGKIAPALMYGNTVVWKPAPSATRIASMLMGIFNHSDLPVNAVRLVTGDHNTAQLLAADKKIHAVTLTGSLAAGHAIQEICARRVLPLQMELSGNNAAIVWRDADVRAAAEQIAWGAFAFAGQRCTANRRAIVHANIFEEFLAELEAATARLRWGDPLEPETEIGPVLNTSKRNELESLIALAKSDGALARVIYPQSQRAAEPWVKTGAYAQPVIACCDHPSHPLVQEETMSPLLVVQRVNHIGDALDLCNGVRHGLIASLFTPSTDLQSLFLQAAEAGVLKINSSTAGVDIALPFGGWKASGLGPPEHGDGDVHFYTRMQAVYGVDKL
ncbi:MAG TPA: aldehyde dehydrogenase family protein [Verrucomicrobiae bacterium]|nr:aldehyde dehydrogenase family protein [Verrucomicrobiae bacterium]